jgi:hypothetical protein
MPTTLVSSGDATLMRSGGTHRINLRLNAVPKTIVATARINQSVFSYPISTLTVDGFSANWYTDVQPGMAVWIGTTPGSYDITAGVIKSAPSTTFLYIDAKSLGDSGYASYIRNGFENDAYVTVLKHRPPWGLLSSIRSGVFYKKWDVVYSDEGSNPPPIIRLGKHRAVMAGQDGIARVQWTADPVPWGTKQITSMVWYGDTGTLVSGNLNSHTFTAEYEPGFYVIQYAANDSGAKISTAFRYLWVNPYMDAGEHASFGAQHPGWTISRDNQEAGRDIELLMAGTLTTDEVYPGQPFLITEDATFDNGQRLANDDCRVNNYIGYVSQVSPSRQRKQRRNKIALQSPITAAKGIPTAPQLVQEKANPTNWAEATRTLTNPVGGIWYAMHHHAPTMLQAHDFEFEEAAKLNREQSLKMQQENLQGQIKSFDDTMPGYLGCRSDGTWKLTLSPMHKNNAGRNAMDVKFVWEDGDINADAGLDYPYTFPQRIGQVKAFGFAYDGGQESRPYASLAPGKAQAQGPGKAQVTFMIPSGSSTAEQARLNELNGHELAAQNPPTPEFGFVVDRNIDVAEPCDRDVWHLLNISPELDPYGVGFENQRAIVSRVSRTWRAREGGGFSKQVRVEFVPETYGQPGLTIPVEREGADDWLTDNWNTELDIPFDQQDEALDSEQEPSDAQLYVTFDFGAYWQDYLIDPQNSITGDNNDSYLAGSGGNPFRCARADYEAGSTIAYPPGTPRDPFLVVQVNFPEDTVFPITITRVRFQFKYTDADNWTSIVFEASSILGTTNPSPSAGVWGQYDETGAQVLLGGSAGTLVSFGFHATQTVDYPDLSSVSFYIDNIEIWYS